MSSFLIDILPKKLRQLIQYSQAYIGLIIAFAIITAWTTSLIIFTNINIPETNKILIIFSILWQAFLFTGLFITAHDAMHGIVFPINPKINNLIGHIAVGLYAFFSYKKLLKRHWQHHQNPASELDPDYHNGKHKNFFAWYFYFMFRYWSWLRFSGMTIAYHSVRIIFHIPEINLILFWAIPLLLSSIQLFYFGTYLPHRKPSGGYQNSHRAQSIYRPFLWSFITCYHFGYHEEHHKYPSVTWWELPRIIKNNKALKSVQTP
ncbi:fatty acid desaturase [Rivularia sp. PCC 7116]|uniref:beta-carotene ketolase CrtW n=1 Tax=Rivularia sp. PCC 7116 TaxID=373994 RepID=UPI00029ED583|nr:fatty acid desaturase [Rivularia sp. PCC 7116]AFY58379.1 fatty acid desaturase [Rivularia sp. PCC 7116]